MLPAKIALGILGSSAIVIGGNEAVAYASGKDGWIISAPKKNNLGQVKDLKTETKELNDELQKGCEIKIWSDDLTHSQIDINAETHLQELFNALKTIPPNCKTTNETKKKIFIKKNNLNNTWTVLSEREAVEGMVKTFDNKCTIKVRVSSNNTVEYKDVKTAEEEISLEGLYEKIENLSTTICKDNNNPVKEIIFHRKDSAWSEMDEKEQIKDLIDKSSFKCEVKIRPKDKSDNSGDQLFKDYSFAEKVSFSNLLTQIKTECTDGQEETKELIYKEGENNNWQKIT